MPFRSPWLEHLSKFRQDNPDFKGNIMVAAKATYKHPKQILVRPHHLTIFIEEEVLGLMTKKYCSQDKINEEAIKLKKDLDNPSNSENLYTIIDILGEYIDCGLISRSLLKVINDNDYLLPKKLIEAYHNDGGTRFTQIQFDE